MIIKPTFLDHWKTRSLCARLNDPLAPIYLLRLWSFCEASGSGALAVPPFAVAAICHFQGDAEAFLNALVECGFIDRDGESLRVHEWEQYNAGLLTARENGARGGRPRKTQTKPTGYDPVNPTETDGLTQENPRVTHGLPDGNHPVNPTEPGGNPPVSQPKPTGNPAVNPLLSPPCIPLLEEDRIGEENHSPLPPSDEGGNEAGFDSPAKRIGWDPKSGFTGIIDEDLDRWREAYPACDIQRQLKAMHSWLLSNPERAKKRVWVRFITNWLSREQDKGGDMRNKTPGSIMGPRHSESARKFLTPTWAEAQRNARGDEA